MVVLRSIRRVKTPPRVSMPSDSGVTSSSSTSLTSPFSTPPWIAAPMATTSSGLTPLCGSLPNSCFTASCTLGMRVMPPTRITSSIWLAVTPASFSACFTGPMVFWIRSSTRLSSLARVILMVRCLGPEASAVMKGRFTSVCCALESSILAFSAASFRRCSARRSVRRSMPFSFLNSSARKLTTRLVEILAAQEGVAIGGLHFEDAVADFQHRDVEGAAAKVIDRDGAGLFLVQAIGQRRGGGLVDDAKNFQARDLAGVLGRLALGVVEIGGNGDDGLGDLLAQMRFGGFLHLLQDEGGDFGRANISCRRGPRPRHRHCRP